MHNITCTVAKTLTHLFLTWSHDLYRKYDIFHILQLLNVSYLYAILIPRKCCIAKYQQIREEDKYATLKFK